MAWEVEYTDEFGGWWENLDADEQESLYAAVILLETLGPSLRYPHTSGVETSRHGHMRELRVQHQGPVNDRWYEEFVPRADRLYNRHIETLQQEGLI